MPHACAMAATGVIGNELFIAGGRGVNHEFQSTLQIYNFTTRTWRIGTPLLRAYGAFGVAFGDGRLYLVPSSPSQSILVYDVQLNAWTEQPPPPIGRFGAGAMHAFAHEGQIVAVDTHGYAVYRGTGTDRSADGLWPTSWRRFDLDMVTGTIKGVAGSVILG